MKPDEVLLTEDDVEFICRVMVWGDYVLNDMVVQIGQRYQQNLLRVLHEDCENPGQHYNGQGELLRWDCPECMAEIRQIVEGG